MSEPEYWLSGPVEGIPSLLQPVAHALLQAKREVTRSMESFPDQLLWVKPAGMAAAGFHLRHLSGVLDRLFTYARGERLSDLQLKYLQAESDPGPELSASLVLAYAEQVERALAQLRNTPDSVLMEPRKVGRAGLPSNTLGLLFHAAEHSMRHTGQLLVTAAIVKEKHLPAGKA